MFKGLGRDVRLTMLAMLIWALGEGLWFNLRQLYLAELGAKPEQIGLALAVEGLARGVLLIPAGILADRIGPRPVMLTAWILGIVGGVAGALAPTWEWLTVAIALYGLSAFAIPSLSSYTLLAAPNRDAPGTTERALTSVYAAYAAGLIFSPLAGGQIAGRMGIRAALWIGSGLFALSTLCMWMTRHHQPEEHHGWLRGAGGLLRNRPFVGLIAFYFAAIASIYVGFALAPNFLNEVRGYSYGWVGAFFSLLSAGTVTWNLALGQVQSRWSISLALGMLWAAMLLLLQVGLAPVVGLAFMLLGSFYTLRSLTSAAISHVVPGAQRGLAFGVAETTLSLAMIVGSRLAGSLYTADPGLPLTVSLAGLPLAMLIGILVSRKQARAEPSNATPQPSVD
jgi:predicted MFS family arabinose efflux permease